VCVILSGGTLHNKYITPFLLILSVLLFRQLHSPQWAICNKIGYMLVHFLVLSHMFGYLKRKLLGRLWKSLFFLKSNFYVSENFKFQCDPFRNKKDVSQRSSCHQWHGIFYFWIFFNETWQIRRWAWNNNNLKVSLKSSKK
jgi:hypothetical protein